MIFFSIGIFSNKNLGFVPYGIYLASATYTSCQKSIGCPFQMVFYDLQHLRLFLDNSEVGEVQQFFDAYYSHVYYIVYEHFIATEQSLRQKGAHKASRPFHYVLPTNAKCSIFNAEDEELFFVDELKIVCKLFENLPHLFCYSTDTFFRR